MEAAALPAIVDFLLQEGWITERTTWGWTPGSGLATRCLLCAWLHQKSGEAVSAQLLNLSVSSGHFPLSFRPQNLYLQN